MYFCKTSSRTFPNRARVSGTPWEGVPGEWGEAPGPYVPTTVSSMLSSSSARNTMNRMSFRECRLSCSQRSSASSLKAMAPGLGCGRGAQSVRGSAGLGAPTTPGPRLRPARPPKGRSGSGAHRAAPDGPGRPTLGLPSASAFSPAPALLVNNARERRLGRILGAARLSAAPAGPT